MADLTFESWSGEYEVETRENWGAWLGYLGVPETNWEAATKAPDFHKYQVTEASFVMDHKIPSTNTHLHFRAPFSGKWTKCPYPQPTAVAWKEEEHKTGTGKPGQWKNTWLVKPSKFQTDIINFAGKGNTMRMTRELQAGGAAIKFDVQVLDPKTDDVVCGPFRTTFKRISDDVPGEPPSPLIIEPAPEGATEMKVTMKRGSGFYANSACSFLRGVDAKPAVGDKEAQDAKPPIEYLRISGLGEAVGCAVVAAAKVVAEELGTITRIQTSYPSMDGLSRGCAQIIIDLKKK